MSDFISREKVFETIWDLFNSYGNNATIFDIDETEAINKFCARLQGKIENQPTAYDVDKVVEQLGKEMECAEKEMEECTFKGMPFYDTQKGYATAMYNAIEIVKKGGVE